MNRALTELIKISRTVGKDGSLVQGGGGNTSVKTTDGKYMYIKASGTALKDMSGQKGWRRLRVKGVLAILKDKSIGRLKVTERENEILNRLNLCCDDDIKTASRPSVESHLHAILAKYVVHLHPLAVDAYVCAKNGRAELGKLFKDEKLPPLWMPYADPGWTLAMKIAGLVDDYKSRYGRKPGIIFLEKHGLLVSSSSANRVLQLVRRVIKACNSKLKMGKTPQIKYPEEFEEISGCPKQNDIIAAKTAIRRAFFQVTGQYVIVKHFIDGNIAKFLSRKDTKKLLSSSALTPDELIYAHGPAMWLDNCDCKTITRKLNRQVVRGEKLAVSFLVKGLGLFVVGNKKTIPVIKDVVATSILIRSFATNFGGVNPLNSRQRRFINEWETENFRQKVASGKDGVNDGIRTRGHQGHDLVL